MATPINWHHSPIAQRILAKLHAGNVERRDHVGIPADFWTYGGADRWAEEAITALTCVRQASIEIELGYAFSDTDTDKTLTRRVAYLAAMERAPEVTQVVEWAFADRRASKVAA
jgi:hypothetical protein